MERKIAILPPKNIPERVCPVSGHKFDTILNTSQFVGCNRTSPSITAAQRPCSSCNVNVNNLPRYHGGKNGKLYGHSLRARRYINFPLIHFVSLRIFFLYSPTWINQRKINIIDLLEQIEELEVQKYPPSIPPVCVTFDILLRVLRLHRRGIN